MSSHNSRSIGVSKPTVTTSLAASNMAKLQFGADALTTRRSLDAFEPFTRALARQAARHAFSIESSSSRPAQPRLGRCDRAF
jgi:hypothetical protein